MLLVRGLSIAVITPTVPTTLTTTRRPAGHTRQYSSKQYHDRHWGPFFEDPHLNRKTSNAAKGDSPVQVGIHLGTEAFLNCRVGMLRDKTVSGASDTERGGHGVINGPHFTGHVGEKDHGQSVFADRGQ